MKQLMSLVTTALMMTALGGASRAEDGREQNRRFKGVELYSWKEQGGDWRFALLDGTNRLKSEDEVKAGGQEIKGTKDLRKALSLLAVGEQVFWTHLIPGFEFPPEATRKEVEKAAEEAQIELRVKEQQE